MGFLDKLRSKFTRNKVTASKVIDLINRSYPLTQISSNIYNIPEIRTAINFIAEKVASVYLYHAKEDEQGNISRIRGKIQNVLSIRTNPKQNPQMFWTQAITTCLLYNNCFIMPEWDDVGGLKWMYIMPFTTCEYGQENEKVTVTFASSYKFYYEDIIHLQKFPSFRGGTDSQSIGNYTKIINTLQSQAVNDAETSGRIAALLQVKTALKGSDMQRKINEFRDLFLTSENTTGFGMIGAEYDIHNLNLKQNPLNKELLDQTVNAVYNYFGVSPEIINNAANELQYEQFIDNTIKPWVYQIEEELTYKLFSDKEITRNNRILGETIDLEISALSTKTAFYDKMLYQGVLNRNEIRKRLGMGRIDGLDEYRTNLNSVAADKINYYQGVGGDEDSENTGQETKTASNI